jgi:hypothetical protein
MTKGDDDRNFNPINNGTTTTTNDDDDDDNDNIYLSKYINNIYLQSDTIIKINKQFCIDSSMQLKDFIKKDIVDKLLHVIKQSDTSYELGNGRSPKNYELGIGNGWQLVGPPHKRRYLLHNDSSNTTNTTNTTNDDSTIGLLLTEIRELFRTPAFSRYVKKLTTLTTIGYRDEIRRFRPGLDYTVAHFGVMTKIPRLDATLCFVDETTTTTTNDDNNNNDDEEEYSCWDSGDVGGFECYIEADSEGLEASEVYRQDKKDDAEESLLSVTPGFNTLSLVLRDQEIMRFIKYLGAAAPGSRFDIAMEYEIIQPESNDDDDDDDDDDDEEEDDDDN